MGQDYGVMSDRALARSESRYQSQQCDEPSEYEISARAEQIAGGMTIDNFAEAVGELSDGQLSRLNSLNDCDFGRVLRDYLRTYRMSCVRSMAADQLRAEQ